MFFKKDNTQLSIMHYEGLPNYQQDFPCFMTYTKEILIFKTKTFNIATLNLSQIILMEHMFEENYMARYHNNPSNTAKFGHKLFTVIHYVNASNERKHIAIWTVDAKAMKFFEKFKTFIPQQDEVQL